MIEHYRLGLLTHPVTKTYLDYKWLVPVPHTPSHVYVTGTNICIYRRTYGRIYYTISILPFFIFLMLLTMEVFYVYFHTNDVFQSTGMVARSNSTCSSFLQFNQTMLTEDGYTDANLATTNFFVKTSLQTNVTRIFSEDNLRCICHPVPTLVNNNNNNNNKTPYYYCLFVEYRCGERTVYYHSSLLFHFHRFVVTVRKIHQTGNTFVYLFTYRLITFSHLSPSSTGSMRLTLWNY